MHGLERFGWDEGWAALFAQHAPPGCVPARVVIEHRGWVDVATAERDAWRARIANRLRHGIPRVDQPSVGDWVALRLPAGSSRVPIVDAILPRRAAFVRRAAGVHTEAQVVGANIDVVLLVVGLDEDFNLRRIERYLAQLGESGSAACVVLSKADLDPEPWEAVQLVQERAPNVPVHVVSALEGQGVDALRALAAEGLTLALVGSSGVGKSTLANALAADDVMPVQEVRTAGWKGAHTTTWRQLIPLSGGGVLLDTPGMREIQLWGERGQVEASFEDVLAVAEGCRFRDCRHEGEPGCAVEVAVEEGSLDPDRVHHYQRLRDEADGHAEARRERERRIFHRVYAAHKRKLRQEQ